MKILGINVSPYVRKALCVAEAKGLDYEHDPQMPGSDDPVFRAASPLGKVPGLIDGQLQVSDSSVICEYLEEKYPEVRMLPATPEQRARARWYDEYGDTKVIEAFSPFFFERFAKKLFGDDSGPDEARLEKVATEIAPPILSYLESQVPESGFLFGDALYIADISLISPMVNGSYGGYEFDAAAYPRTATYRDRVLAHPAMARVLATEAELMKAMAG